MEKISADFSRLFPLVSERSWRDDNTSFLLVCFLNAIAYTSLLYNACRVARWLFRKRGGNVIEELEEELGGHRVLDFTTRTYFSDAVLCLDDGNGVAGDGERFFVNKALLSMYSPVRAIFQQKSMATKTGEGGLKSLALTVVTLAEICELLGAIYPQRTPINARHLLNSGGVVVEVDALNARGRSALMIAAIHKRLGIAQLLLERVATVDNRKAYGRTALFYAIQRRSKLMVKHLLMKGYQLLESGEMIQKLASIAQELAHDKYAAVQSRIAHKYDEIERLLIEEFVKTHDRKRLREIATILAEFKGYAACLDVFVEQLQNGAFRSGNVFDDIVALCERAQPMLEEISPIRIR